MQLPENCGIRPQEVTKQEQYPKRVASTGRCKPVHAHKEIMTVPMKLERSVLVHSSGFQRGAPPSRECKWMAPCRSSAPALPNFSIALHPAQCLAVLPLSPSSCLGVPWGRPSGNFRSPAGFQLCAALAESMPDVWELGAPAGFAAWRGGDAFIPWL